MLIAPPPCLVQNDALVIVLVYPGLLGGIWGLTYAVVTGIPGWCSFMG